MNSKLARQAAMLLLALSSSTMSAFASPPTPKPAPCSAPEYHQFDFWVGDWEAFDVANNEKDAHVRVDRILDGCVLWEQYDGVDGHRGQSFTIYDASRKTWHQSWVTNRGELLTIEGGLQGDTMVLSGDEMKNKVKTLVRGEWKPEPGGVRETGVTSTDGGKTWKPWFDLNFRPMSQADQKAQAADDAKVIAALDSEYQAAVKANDVAAMERLLGDDFVLVAGSGKIYRKVDLLEEARSGRVVYEHPEDTAQTVRVWGDTAVISAKLWEKGTDAGKPFDYTVWFSDTYVRTAAGWRYVFGQSSLPLPNLPP